MEKLTPRQIININIDTLNQNIEVPDLLLLQHFQTITIDNYVDRLALIDGIQDKAKFKEELCLHSNSIYNSILSEDKIYQIRCNQEIKRLKNKNIDTSILSNMLDSFIHNSKSIKCLRIMVTKAELKQLV